MQNKFDLDTLWNKHVTETPKIKMPEMPIIETPKVEEAKPLDGGLDLDSLWSKHELDAPKQGTKLEFRKAPEEPGIPLNPTPEQAATMDRGTIAKLSDIRNDMWKRKALKEEKKFNPYETEIKGRKGAFLEGFLPSGERGEDRRRLYPGATMVGRFAKYAALSSVFKGIAPAIEGALIKTPMFLFDKTIPVIAHGIQNGLFFGANSIIDEMAKGTDLKEGVKTVAQDAAFGMILGNVHGLPTNKARIYAHSVARGAWSAGKSLLDKGYLDKDDLVDMALNASLGAFLESLNASATTRKYWNARQDNLFKKKLMLKLNPAGVMDKTGKYKSTFKDKVLVKKLIGQMEHFTRGFNKQAYVCMTEKIPASVSKLTPKLQKQYYRFMLKQLKQGLSTSDAIKVAGEWLATKVPNLQFTNDIVQNVAKNPNPKTTIPDQYTEDNNELRDYLNKYMPAAAVARLSPEERLNLANGPSVNLRNYALDNTLATETEGKPQTFEYTPHAPIITIGTPGTDLEPVDPITGEAVKPQDLTPQTPIMTERSVTMKLFRGGSLNSKTGIYFTDDKELAESFGIEKNEGTLEANVTMRNPKRIVRTDSSPESSNLTEKKIQTLKEKGYDGFITTLPNGKIYEVVAFDKSQIKTISQKPITEMPVTTPETPEVEIPVVEEVESVLSAVEPIEAVNTIKEEIRKSVLSGWFRNGDKSYKPHLYKSITENPEIKNAGLNVMHQVYNTIKGKKLSFDAFMNTKISLYRATPDTEDDFTSYSMDKEMASRFGKVHEIKIKPKYTLGSYQTTSEAEVLIAKDKLPKTKVEIVVPSAKIKELEDKPTATIGEDGTSVNVAPKEGELKYKTGDLKARGILSDEQLWDALKKAVASHAGTISAMAQFTGHTYSELLSPKGSNFPGVMASRAYIEMQNYNFVPGKHEINKWLNDNTQAAVKRTIMKMRVVSENVTDAQTAAKYKKVQKDLIKENGVEPTLNEIAERAQFLKNPIKNLQRAQEIKDLINMREGQVSLDSITEHGYEPGTEDTAEDYFAKAPGVLPDKLTTQSPNAMEMPELVSLVKILTDKDINIKNLAKAYGYHKAGVLTLDPKIFKNTKFAMEIMAHEIGHLIDWFPDELSKGIPARGNMLGHMQSVRNFMQSTFGDLENTALRDELKALTKWWTPFEPKKGDSYTAYRHSSKELYAEAISAMFNQPEAMRERAPIFYKAFWDNVHKKPTVKKALDEIFQIIYLNPAEKAKHRAGRLIKDMGNAEGRFRNLHAKKVLNERSYWHHFKSTIIDRASPIIDKMNAFKKSGGIINPEDNPMFYLHEHNYIGGKLKNLFYDILIGVIEPINATGFTMAETEVELGLYLFWNRVMTERATMANPEGETEATAASNLKEREKLLGPEKWKAIVDGGKAMRNIMENVLTKMKASGLYNQEQYNMTMKNKNYSPFQVIEHMDENVTPNMINQEGTLKAIQNTFTTYTLKLTSMIRSIERNNTNRAVINFLAKIPGELRAAKIYHDPVSKRTTIPDEKGFGIIKIFEDGKMKAFYTDPYVADSVNFNPSMKARKLIHILSYMNKGVFRPLYVTLNLGFQVTNLRRDFERGWKANYHVTLPEFIMQYAKSAPVAAQRIWGKTIPKTIYDMQQNGMLSVTYNELNLGSDAEDQADSQVAYLLKSTGLLDTAINKNWFTKSLDTLQISKTADLIADVGEFIETWGKVVGYESRVPALNRGDISMKELAHEVRNYAGSPDFLTKGTWYPFTNEIFLFSNAQIQGMKGDFEAAFKNPKTRTGYWLKTAAADILPAILAFAAVMGLYGDKTKKLYDQISEFDKANYQCIILGETENGRTIYFRMPMDESGRLIHALVWKVLNKGKGSTMRDLLSIAMPISNMAPQVAPSAEILAKFGELVFKTVEGSTAPIYSLAGRKIVSEDEMQASVYYPWRPSKQFLKFAINKTGVRWAPSKDGETKEEKVLKHIPVVSRFIKFSPTQEEINRWDSWKHRNTKRSINAVAKQMARERNR